MTWRLGRGSFSKSSSVSVTYSFLAYSYPRTVSLHGTSTSSVGHQRTCLSRVPQVAWSRWKLMSLLSVAPYSFTGMLTIPKLIEPLQIALAMRPPLFRTGRRSTQHGFSTPRRRFPQGCQHKLLINNNLRCQIIYNEGGHFRGAGHTAVSAAWSPYRRSRLGGSASWPNRSFRSPWGQAAHCRAATAHRSPAGVAERWARERRVNHRRMSPAPRRPRRTGAWGAGQTRWHGARVPRRSRTTRGWTGQVRAKPPREA